MTSSPNSDPKKQLRSRAWYDATLDQFQAASEDEILGEMARRGTFDLGLEQRDAWLVEIDLLRRCVQGIEGAILLEFVIPRLGARIDAVLLVGAAVIVIEFKIGAKQYDKHALEQVWDYALDLKNFHEASHEASIVPILVATQAKSRVKLSLQMDHDNVYRPLAVNDRQLSEAIRLAVQQVSGESIEMVTWSSAPYHPTPTIIDAARALYANHSVESIARHDAGAQNLAKTSQRIEALVDEAREHRRKIICFVTGVPGAGKTLVGLNLATQRREIDESTHAVFLSGNGPLVAVLREALTRDEHARQKKLNKRARKADAGRSVKAFIQNIHHFRDEALIDTGPPDDHIAIFDEAQRAWDLPRTSSFMQQRKNRLGFNESEPEFLVSYLDRHTDWAAIVCLVGGGQEINRGEAGIQIWSEAILKRFPDWHMYASSRLIDSEYGSGGIVTDIKSSEHGHFDDDLHLGVSMRSFRAENVSAFVKALLDCEREGAMSALEQFIDKYPIAITRNLAAAKQWIRSHARGSERYGLVASSSAERLKPHAIDVRFKPDPVHWFLDGKEDTRSSYFLEDAATEFLVQGLEVDWALVTWDGDLRFDNPTWSFHEFYGSKWRNVRNAERQRYLKNAYRVLLTRARQGMVIFVPEGDSVDATRDSRYYDSTYEYLRGVGIPVLG